MLRDAQRSDGVRQGHQCPAPHSQRQPWWVMQAGSLAKGIEKLIEIGGLAQVLCYTTTIMIIISCAIVQKGWVFSLQIRTLQLRHVVFHKH